MNIINLPIFETKRQIKAYSKETISMILGNNSLSNADLTTQSILELLAISLIEQQQQNNNNNNNNCNSGDIIKPVVVLNNEKESIETIENKNKAISSLSNDIKQQDTKIINSKSNSSCILFDSAESTITQLALSNTSDFCAQYRKRINEAKERLIQKQKSKEMSTTAASKAQVSTSTNYMNYPPKKRHKLQQQHIQAELATEKTNDSSKLLNKISSDDMKILTENDDYKDKRRKNNEAAKRSRDVRRAKEDDIALRAANLERENLQLKVELAELKQETNRLRCLIYNS